MNPTLYYTTHASTIGTLILVAGARGLRYVGLLGEGEAASDRLARLFSTPPAPTLLPLDGFFASATLEMDRYFREAGARLTLPYELVGGTALQRAVWLEIARIPYGETISYSTLAERVGFPRAIRAVASACGANPLPLVIPCHRVVAKDGTLGGFSLGGLAVKETLLALEAPKAETDAAAA